MIIYSFILFNGFIQFYCNEIKCKYNEKRLCKIKYVFLSNNFECFLKNKEKNKN